MKTKYFMVNFLALLALSALQKEARLTFENWEMVPRKRNQKA